MKVTSYEFSGKKKMFNMKHLPSQVGKSIFVSKHLISVIAKKFKSQPE